MKIYKSKIMKTINFIKNEGKFERGDMVKVLNVDSNTGANDWYTKYVNKYGIVVGIDYSKKDYIVGVKFEDKEIIDLMPKELEKILPENPLRYQKLNIEY